jgi:2-dehydropantoate 2-reductase
LTNDSNQTTISGDLVKIAVVGAGAMGSLFSYFFQRAGYFPCLLDCNGERVDALRREGLTVETPSGEHQVSLSIVTTEANEIGQVDLIVIAVKAYDTELAMKGALPLLGDKTVVLTLQNGLYNIERIARMTGKNRVLGGTTAHGATQLSHTHLRHAGSGETIIGVLQGEQVLQVNEVSGLLNQSGVETRITDDINGTIWGKLLVNAAINPLTALTRITNGEIIECSELVDVQRRVVGEVCAVAKKKKVTIHFSDPVVKVKEVCIATASNQSSMLQDILNGKRTEIDFINGAIVAEGTACGVSTPYNQILTRLVKALEIQQENQVSV